MPDAGDPLRARLVLDNSGFKGGLEETEGAAKHFKETILDVGKAIGIAFSIEKVFEFGKESIAAFAGAETSAVRLNQAFTQQGVTSHDTREEAFKLAESLAHVSSNSHVAIEGAERLLVSMAGLSGEGLDRATKASVNLSAALGIDLQSAAMMVAKAHEGNTNSLHRYGITVADTKDKTVAFDSALEQIEKKFGGAATAELDTYTGQMNQFHHSVEDLQEALGSKLAPILETAAKAWTHYFEAMKPAVSETDVGKRIGEMSHNAHVLTEILDYQSGELHTLSASDKAAAEALLNMNDAQFNAALGTKDLTDRITKLVGVYRDTGAEIKKNAEDQEAARVASDKHTKAIRDQSGALQDSTPLFINNNVVAAGAAPMLMGAADAFHMFGNAATEAGIAIIHHDAILEANKRHLQEVKIAHRDVAVAVKQTRVEEQLLGQAFNQVGDAMIGMIFDGTKAEAAAKNLARTVASELIHMAIAKIIAAAFTTNAEVSAYMAPAVGPAAPAVGAAAAAPILALVAQIPAFGGGGTVPGSGNEDNVLARLTPGEGVLSKDAMARLRGGGGGGPTLVINIGNFYGTDKAALTKWIRESFAPIWNRLTGSNLADGVVASLIGGGMGSGI